MGVVLAIDDDPDVLALLEVTLRRGGHDALLASGVDDALEVLSERDVDLILLDVMMPARDGWSLLEELKADDRLQGTPVIMVTARGERVDHMTSGIGGAVRHVAKPFLPMELLATIDEILRSEVPELDLRRAVQRQATRELATGESGRGAGRGQARPRLSSLQNERSEPAPRWAAASERLASLTASQKELLVELASGRSVAQLALGRDVSRSNIYASIRRIHRKLGTDNLDDLRDVVEATGLTSTP